jgi:hypothetical protein
MRLALAMVMPTSRGTPTVGMVVGGVVVGAAVDALAAVVAKAAL